MKVRDGGGMRGRGVGGEIEVRDDGGRVDGGREDGGRDGEKRENEERGGSERKREGWRIEGQGKEER